MGVVWRRRSVFFFALGCAFDVRPDVSDGSRRMRHVFAYVKQMIINLCLIIVATALAAIL
jgi:hypothetical protein